MIPFTASNRNHWFPQYFKHCSHQMSEQWNSLPVMFCSVYQNQAGRTDFLSEKIRQCILHSKHPLEKTFRHNSRQSEIFSILNFPSFILISPTEKIILWHFHYWFHIFFVYNRLWIIRKRMNTITANIFAILNYL